MTPTIVAPHVERTRGFVAGHRAEMTSALTEAGFEVTGGRTENFQYDIEFRHPLSPLVFEYNAVDFLDQADGKEAPVGVWLNVIVGLSDDDLDTVEQSIAKLSYYVTFKNALIVDEPRLAEWSCEPQPHGEVQSMFNIFINWEGDRACAETDAAPTLELLADVCRATAEHAAPLMVKKETEALVLPPISDRGNTQQTVQRNADSTE